MDEIRLRPSANLCGSIQVPGDKSISHRALFFGALADGVTQVSGLLNSDDVKSTAACLRAVGVEIRTNRPGDLNRNHQLGTMLGALVEIQGLGLRGFTQPNGPLDCGNSGTTIRLLMGILAGCPLDIELFGDASLSKRPMRRVAEPLRKMGARIELTRDNTPPIRLQGGDLQAIDFVLPVASAQTKSAILLAGLFAKGTTRIRGRIESRDHTERLLPAFGVHLKRSNDSLEIEGGQRLHATHIRVPGDPSSAAFFLAAATLTKNSSLTLENVGLNPTRTGFINVLCRMGAKIQTHLTEETPEPIGSLLVKSAPLHGTTILADEVPSLIDELPLVAILGACAQGRTEVRGAEELRVKESDRIAEMAKGLRAMGGSIEERPDGFVIEGPQKLSGARINPQGDHRIAMAFAVASLVAEGETILEDPSCATVSYPNFFEQLAGLKK